MTGWPGDKVNAMQDRPPHPVTPLHVKPLLPIPPTPLIGRERELVELGELISNPQCRLITICGPGGIGRNTPGAGSGGETKRPVPTGAVFLIGECCQRSTAAASDSECAQCSVTGDAGAATTGLRHASLSKLFVDFG